MQEAVLNLLSARKGHFLLESGHHGDLWLDLETLCLQPRTLQPFTAELARRIAQLGVDAICGPLVEGAFVGLMVASLLGTQFIYSERFSRPTPDGLFPVGYRIPNLLRGDLRGKRVAIVNDVINAGSAVKGTFADLRECGAAVVTISALLVLGTAAAEFACQVNVTLDSLVNLPNNLWTAKDCPLCRAGAPLDN